MEIRGINVILNVVSHGVICPVGGWARNSDLEEHAWFADVLQALHLFLRLMNTNVGRGSKRFASQQKLAITVSLPCS